MNAERHHCPDHDSLAETGHNSPCAWMQAVCWILGLGIPLLLSVMGAGYHQLSAAQTGLSAEMVAYDVGAIERTTAIASIKTSLSYIERDLAQVRQLLEEQRQSDRRNP